MSAQISATRLDRAIAAVAPRLAIERLVARQAFENMARRAYDGAAGGR